MGRRLCSAANVAMALVMGLALGGCGNLLNEKMPGASEGLAEELGITYQEGSSEPTSTSVSVSGTLTGSGTYIIYRFYAHAETYYSFTLLNTDGITVWMSAGTSAADPADLLSEISSLSSYIYPISDGNVYVKVWLAEGSGDGGGFSLSVSNDTYGISLGVEEDYRSGLVLDVNPSFCPYLSEYTYVNLTSENTPVWYTFAVETGYAYFVCFNDARCVPHAETDAHSYTQGTYSVYDSAGRAVGTRLAAQNYRFVPSSSGTYGFSVSIADEAGDGAVAFRLWRVVTASSGATPYTVQDEAASGIDGYTSCSISSGVAYAYTFTVVSGYTYMMQWLDSETDTDSLLSDPVDGTYVIVSPSGSVAWVGDTVATSPLTALKESGEYTLYIQTAKASGDAGMVGFRIYREW